VSLSKLWDIWKHALGSYSEEDGYNPANDNAVAYIRTFIVGINIVCGIMIMLNIIIGWL
jgi:hypothetical protein